MPISPWLRAPVAVALIAAGCAHSPASAPAEAAPSAQRLPGPVRLVVRATDPELKAVLPAAQAQAEQGLTSLGHTLREDAAVLVEIDLGPRTPSATGSCIALKGRVVHADQPFAAPEFDAQQCADRSTTGAGDGSGFNLAALTSTKELPQQTPVSAGLSTLLSRLSMAARR